MLFVAEVAKKPMISIKKIKKVNEKSTLLKQNQLMPPKKITKKLKKKKTVLKKN